MLNKNEKAEGIKFLFYLFVSRVRENGVKLEKRLLPAHAVNIKDITACRQCKIEKLHCFVR